MRGLYFCMVVFLFACYSTALGQTTSQPYEVVKGNLSFYPSQTHGVIAHVELRYGPEENASTYKEKQTETMKPFNFRITVDQKHSLETLFVKILVRKPQGFACKLCDLKASECERLKNIPIQRKDDIYFQTSLEAKTAMALGNFDEAKRKSIEAQSWATNSKQVLISSLDLADFLSQYKSERANVVKVLAEVEDRVYDTPLVIQKRYWRLRRDATMRLAGFNDFQKMPLEQFAESVANAPGSTAWKAWTDFTQSFASDYEKNEHKWFVGTQGRLTKDTLNCLQMSLPQKEEVMGQLVNLEPVLGPAIIVK